MKFGFEIKNIKKFFIAIGISSIFLIYNFFYVYAINFKDVNQNFWAYEYINNVAEKGLITADAAGYFKPNDNINKFETAKIFAKTAGYKYNNLMGEEKSFYDNAYEKNKYLLESQAKKYVKWQKVADKEIAFLLEKNIFTPGDLEKFIVKDNKKNEKLRALSKEEAAVYLTRILEEDVSKYNDCKGIFADESFIASDYLSSVYCLYKNKIITGDENNKFNPKQAVTKTILSVMLSKTLDFKDSSKVNEINYISGKIDKIYYGIGAIQIINSDGEKNIYKLKDNAEILIDNNRKRLNDLTDGMEITGSLENSVLVYLKAENYSSKPDVDFDLNCINGIVDDIRNNEIAIKIQMINPVGGILNQTQKYILTENCKISRENKKVDLKDIKIGEIVKIEFLDSKAYGIYVVDKNKKIEGILKEKKNENNKAVLVIEDKNDNLDYELKVNNNTVIKRKNNGTVSWSDLKIGDKVSASCEYDNLTDIYAEGEKSNKEGWIEEIRILRDRNCIIKFKNEDDNKIYEYNISQGKIDISRFGVGDKVRIRLDSSEIENLNVMDKTSTNYFGEVLRIFDNDILRIRTESGSEIEINCNRDTEFRNINGRVINIGNIRRGNKVYISMDNRNSNVADFVRIVGEN